MRDPNTSTRRSWRAMTASRGIPIQPKTWPPSRRMAWTRPPPSSILVTAPGSSRSPPRAGSGMRRRWPSPRSCSRPCASVRTPPGWRTWTACGRDSSATSTPGRPPTACTPGTRCTSCPTFWKALALDRIARMLRPGGVLRLRDLIYDFGPAEAESVFTGWLGHAAADPADGYTSADYAEHIRTEFSTFRWLLEPMLAAAGFEIVTVDFERRLYGAYTCVKSARLAHG